MSYFTHFSPSVLHLWNLVCIWYLIQTSHILGAHQPHMATYALSSIGSMFLSCLKTCTLKVAIKCASLGCSYLLTPHRGIHALQPFSCSIGACVEKGHSFWPNIVNVIFVWTSPGLCKIRWPHPCFSLRALPPEICCRKWKVAFFVLIFVKIFAWPKR